MVKKYPFKEKQLTKNCIERSFSEKIDKEDLQWHFDDEDRLVECIESTDWQIQFDNELPQKFKGQIFIPKGEYHRLIKGTKDCKVKIYKL